MKYSFLHKPLVILLFLLACLYSSCRLICNTRDLGNIDLPADHKALVPYTTGQEFTFTDTSGTSMNCRVVSREQEYEYGDNCKCGCCDYTYMVQSETTKLVCQDCGLDIQLQMMYNYYPGLTSTSSFVATINGGYDHFGLDMDGKTASYYDTYHEVYDSLDLNGVMYHDVHFYSNDYHSSVDSSASRPVHLYYNTSHGILKIEMNDGQAFTRK